MVSEPCSYIVLSRSTDDGHQNAIAATVNFMRTLLGRFFFVSGVALVAFGADSKLATDLHNLNPSSSVDVIIQYKQAPAAAHHRNVANRGGELKREFSIIKAAHYSVPASALADLANDPDVVAITPNREVNGFLDLTAQAVNANWAWRAFNVNGNNIGVAVIDSGISQTGDLSEGQV